MTESNNTQNQPAPDAIAAAIHRLQMEPGFDAFSAIIRDARAEHKALLARAEATRVALEAADKMDDGIRLIAEAAYRVGNPLYNQLVEMRAAFRAARAKAGA